MLKFLGGQKSRRRRKHNENDDNGSEMSDATSRESSVCSIDASDTHGEVAPSGSDIEDGVYGRLAIHFSDDVGEDMVASEAHRFEETSAIPERESIVPEGGSTVRELVLDLNSDLSSSGKEVKASEGHSAVKDDTVELSGTFLDLGHNSSSSDRTRRSSLGVGGPESDGDSGHRHRKKKKKYGFNVSKVLKNVASPRAGSHKSAKTSLTDVAFIPENTAPPTPTDRDVDNAGLQQEYQRLERAYDEVSELLVARAFTIEQLQRAREDDAAQHHVALENLQRQLNHVMELRKTSAKESQEVVEKVAQEDSKRQLVTLSSVSTQTDTPRMDLKVVVGCGVEIAPRATDHEKDVQLKSLEDKILVLEKEAEELYATKKDSEQRKLDNPEISRTCVVVRVEHIAAVGDPCGDISRESFKTQGQQSTEDASSRKEGAIQYMSLAERGARVALERELDVIKQKQATDLLRFEEEVQRYKRDVFLMEDQLAAAFKENAALQKALATERDEREGEKQDRKKIEEDRKRLGSLEERLKQENSRLISLQQRLGNERKQLDLDKQNQLERMTAYDSGQSLPGNQRENQQLKQPASIQEPLVMEEDKRQLALREAASKAKRLEESLKEAEEKIEKLSNELKSAHSQVMMERDHQKRQEALLTKLTDEVERTKLEHKKQLEEWEKKLMEEKKEQALYCKHTQEQQRHYEVTRDKMNEELERLKSDACDLGSELNALRSANSALKTELEGWKAEACNLVSELDVLRLANPALKEEVERLKAEVCKLNSELNGLCSVKSALVESQPTTEPDIRTDTASPAEAAANDQYTSVTRSGLHKLTLGGTHRRPSHSKTPALKCVPKSSRNPTEPVAIQKPNDSALQCPKKENSKRVFFLDESQDSANATILNNTLLTGPGIPAYFHVASPGSAGHRNEVAVVCIAKERLYECLFTREQLVAEEKQNIGRGSLVFMKENATVLTRLKRLLNLADDLQNALLLSDAKLGTIKETTASPSSWLINYVNSMQQSLEDARTPTGSAREKCGIHGLSLAELRALIVLEREEHKVVLSRLKRETERMRAKIVALEETSTGAAHGDEELKYCLRPHAAGGDEHRCASHSVKLQASDIRWRMESAHDDNAGTKMYGYDTVTRATRTPITGLHFSQRFTDAGSL